MGYRSKYRFLTLAKRDGRCCFYCKKRIKYKVATFDHRHPKSLGGKDNLENLVIACTTCNEAKGNRTEAEFTHVKEIT